MANSNLKIGIVGLPNVGKSTLFNAVLGKAQAAASNFPFCTIEPNIGIVPVPDVRLDTLTKMEKSAKVVPAAIQLVDIAGLVKGAHEGQGLGNQFLSHIREVDAIIEVVRLFKDANVLHVSGQVNPEDDISTINTELMLADLQTIDKYVARLEKEAKRDPKLLPYFEVSKKIQKHLADGKSVRSFLPTTSEDELAFIKKELHLLSAKPILYVANIDHDQISQTDILEPIQKIAENEGAEVIAVDAKDEAELAELPAEDQQAFLQELGLIEPGLNKIIKSGYKLLDLITFFTAGPTESHAWTVWQGARAPQAAGVIHTDFEKGFIKAEIVSYEDLISAGGMKQATELGKVRQEGKEYLMQDGDVVYFRFNV